MEDCKVSRTLRAGVPQNHFDTTCSTEWMRREITLRDSFQMRRKKWLKLTDSGSTSGHWDCGYGLALDELHRQADLGHSRARIAQAVNQNGRAFPTE